MVKALLALLLLAAPPLAPAANPDPAGIGPVASLDPRIESAPPTREETLELLLRLEGYVRTLENATYGYSPGNGFPMYLFNFGMMHRSLYLLTGEPAHLASFSRAADIAASLMNPDGTWTLWNTSLRMGLYNWQAMELFIEAWRLTADGGYLDLAGRAARGALNVTHLKVPGGAFNHRFLVASAWAHYIFETGDRDPALVAEGRSQLSQALEGFDAAGVRWFYNPQERDAGFYDGHAAYYHFGLLTTLFYWLDAMLSVFREETVIILTTAAEQEALATSFLLPSGTWYYTAAVPDYTEGAADAALGYELLAPPLRVDRSDEIDRALSTLRDRQAPSGGFFKTANSTEVEPWFSDNVAYSLGEHLLRTAPPGERAQAAVNALRREHFEPGEESRLDDLEASLARLGSARTRAEILAAFLAATGIVWGHLRGEFRLWAQSLVAEVRSLGLSQGGVCDERKCGSGPP